jgi:hypothetical protein
MANARQHRVGLKQYRKLDGRWQFFPIAERQNAKTGTIEPDLRFVRVNGNAIPSTGGTFYIDTQTKTANADSGPSANLQRRLSINGKSLSA